MPRPTRRDVHIDGPLTQISLAYRNVNYIASRVFPSVPVEKASDKYFIFDKGAWFRIANRSLRAPGTRARRVDYTVSTGSYSCVEHALAQGVPDEVRENADDPLDPETSAVEFVTDSLLRVQEKRVADLVSTNGSSNWANSASPTTQWDSDTSDPVGDVETGRNTVVQNIGVMPNTMVLGFETWSHLKQHPDLMDRIKYTQKGVLTPELVAGIFEVENLLIGMAVKDAAEYEGQSASMGFIWGKQVVLMYVPPNPGLMVPAAGYSFVWKGFQTNRYREDQEKQDVFEVVHSVAEKITGSDAGYCIYKVIS